MNRPPNLCFYCKRWDSTNAERNVCEAFPGGIPDAIWTVAFDHRDRFGGEVDDKVFDPINPDARTLVEVIYGSIPKASRRATVPNENIDL